MTNDQSDIALSLDDVAMLSRAALSRLGLADAHVEAVTATIVAGERDGCASHGIYRLLVCADTLATGKVAKDAVPVVDDRAGGVAGDDGEHRGRCCRDGRDQRGEGAVRRCRAGSLLDRRDRDAFH